MFLPRPLVSRRLAAPAALLTADFDDVDDDDAEDGWRDEDAVSCADAVDIDSSASLSITSTRMMTPSCHPGMPVTMRTGRPVAAVD